MTTTLGKILTFVTLTASLLMAAFAFGLWSNRIEWATPPGVKDDEVTGGRFTQLSKELERTWGLLRPAEGALGVARTAVMIEEKGRSADRVWYMGRMEHLKTKADINDPVKGVVFADKDDPATKTRKGQVLINPTDGYPALEPLKDRAGQPLVSMAFYNNRLKEILADREQIEKKHKAQIDEATKLTADLLVLRRRFEAERQKRNDVEDEVRRVYPLLVNTRVDAELVLKRNHALQERVKELKTTGVAVGE
jgi:hypothetical protein